MVSRSLIAATVALMYGATAQAGGPLLPRVQAGLKQLPALTAPVVATARSLTSIKALPALSAPLLTAAALPGLKSEAKVSYYYPRPDPGHGSDWLDYNLNTNQWFTQDFSPYFWNIAAVGLELSADLGAQVLAASEIINPAPCSECGGNDPADIPVRVQEYASAILDFGLSRGAGVGKKVGPAPLPKRPEELAAFTPMLIDLNESIFGSYYGVP